MKRADVVLILFLTVAATAWAQIPAPATATSKSVVIDAVQSNGSSKTVNHWRDMSGNYSQTKTTSKELTITVRNMSALPGEFEIEWYFFGKPASGSGRFLYDKGSKKISVAPGAFETFPVESKELSAKTVRDFYYYGYNYTSGDKAEGWLIRAKVGDEVVRLKASSPQLEQLASDETAFARLVNRTKK
jgi:hypothetical protein